MSERFIREEHKTEVINGQEIMMSPPALRILDNRPCQQKH